jgi:glycosyltransferase involved in cell wall biosynthesis
LPFAVVLRHVFGCPVLPFVYGIEAWTPTPHRLVNRMARRIDAFASIRHFTAERLKGWARIPDAKCYYIPNCIDPGCYGVAPRRGDLVERYGLGGRTIIATAGRLDPHPAERSKGFDEVMEALPSLARSIHDVLYLIIGDGADRPRLEEKARRLGVPDRVVFTGYVHEDEKADHYRLADVFAMPGSNPVFDRYPYRFVFLEALACGVPVVGARLTDPSEANDPDAGALIAQVDPNDPADIERGILRALERRGRGVDPRLRKFFYGAFETRVTEMLDDIMLRRDCPKPKAVTVPSPG